MLAAFNGTWDWTAIGTLTLAAVTLALAAATFWMVKLTRRALIQSRDEIALSRREVEEAHRPVLVPVVIARPPQLGPSPLPSGPRAFPDRPCVIVPSTLVVPVKNIGSGPALNVVASVERLGDEGAPWTGPIDHQTPGLATGIGNGELVHIPIHAHGWEERWNFKLTLMYEDVAEKRWTTAGCYVATSRRYERVGINLS